MPELPEVETVVRELRHYILNRPIERFELTKTDILRRKPADWADVRTCFAARSFTGIDRVGKFMIWHLDNGSQMVAHLGMTGKFVVARHNDPQPVHLCSQFYFADGGRLDHIDVRRFGKLELYTKGETIPILNRLGIDPLSPAFDGTALLPIVRTFGNKPRKQAIHTTLMDQRLIAGVGNIYAAEALFLCGIRPRRQAGRTTKAERQRLAEALQSVLQRSIEQGGTTVSDYRRVDDKPGNFREMIQVYDRQDQPCRICGTLIKRVRLNGRSAYYCPRCQK